MLNAHMQKKFQALHILVITLQGLKL